MSETYTWWTLDVGKVNHALATTTPPDQLDLSICGREGQFSPGAWLPGDAAKRECRSCAAIIKAMAAPGGVRRSIIFNNGQ